MRLGLGAHTSTYKMMARLVLHDKLASSELWSRLGGTGRASENIHLRTDRHGEQRVAVFAERVGRKCDRSCGL